LLILIKLRKTFYIYARFPATKLLEKIEEMDMEFLHQ